MRATTAWSLRRRASVLTAAVAAVLALIAVTAAITAAANRTDARHVMDHLTPAMLNQDELYVGLLRQEDSVRAYALTGRDDDLVAYRDAVEQEGQLLASNDELLTGEPRLRARLRGVAQATVAYRDEVAEPLIARVRAFGPNATLAVPDDHARDTFGRAADSITSLGRDLTTRRDEVRLDANATSTALVVLLFGAVVTVVLAAIALAELLRRMVTQPILELGAQVRRVAGGDYEHEIEGGGPGELARLARDVNAMRQQINRDLVTVEQQAEELTRSNRDLEQFAYVASHDLQEPLRKVASFCQLLQRRYAGQLDERADQYIAFAVDGAQRMQRLINDLLAFSRIGRFTSGFTDVDLNKVAQDAAWQFDTVREETEAEITFEGLPTVRGEEPLLGALFANLIGNALKFRRPDRPPRVHLSARRVDGEWEVACEDNGIGIAPEFTEKVFVIFQRLHAKESYAGTGIGLAIAKKIVEYHGGRIWVDTNHPDGTLLRFTLPASSPDAPGLSGAPGFEEST
jgi:signal transduction histidine kinase